MEVICLTPRKEEEETLTSVTGIEIEMEQQQPGSPVPVKQSRHLFLPESRQNEEASRCSFIVLDSWLLGRPELGCRHMIVIVVVDDSILQTSIMISEAVLAR